MELFPSRLFHSLKRFWRRRRYHRINDVGKKNMKVIRLGGGSPRRAIRVRPPARLPLRLLSSPVKLLARVRDAYINAMLGLAGRSAASFNTSDAFGAKRIPRSRSVRPEKGKEFERRLLFEVCKSISASRNFSPDLNLSRREQ